MRHGPWWVLLVVLALLALACGGGGDDDDDGSNGDDATENGSGDDDDGGDDDGDDGGNDDGDDDGGDDDGDNGGDDGDNGGDDGDGGSVGGDVCDLLSVEAVSEATGVDDVEAIESGFADNSGTCTYLGVGGSPLIGLLLLGGESAEFAWDSNQDIPGAEEVDVDGGEALWFDSLFSLYLRKGDFVVGVTALAPAGRTNEEVARAVAQEIADNLPD